MEGQEQPHDAGRRLPWVQCPWTAPALPLAAHCECPSTAAVEPPHAGTSLGSSGALGVPPGNEGSL